MILIEVNIYISLGSIIKLFNLAHYLLYTIISLKKNINLNNNKVNSKN